MSEPRLRTATLEDRATLAELWTACGIRFRHEHLRGEPGCGPA